MKLRGLSRSPSALSLKRISIGFSCLVVALFAGCEKAAPPAPTPPLVEVLSVEGRDVPIYREWVGSIDGDINATIRPQVTGYLIKQNYREGDVVKKGQVLFEIDPRTFQAAVDQAKAARSQQLANHATAAANLARIRPLAEKNAVSRKDLDDAIGSELSARALLDQATAALDTARLNLEFTRIVSPINGIAGIAKAQIGDLLSPTAQTELTTVSSVDPIKVYINISEREYLQFNQGEQAGTRKDLPLELILVDGSTYPKPGKFGLMDRQVDPTTGTFKVGALFANPDGRLRPGQFAKIRATLEVDKGALLVPQRAVTEIQGQYLIAVVGEGNKVDLRQVKPGERIGSDWIIKEGLKPGEKIVVEGTQKVRAGAIVTPKPFGPAASESPAPAKG
ncbi:efflux RND transporter periplasmic adaptor subunit [Propionivibrio limicola]|uniref:efflux RND transporter periplasmic adaptor subunit n=1 Tax=Propionivibrio limicola TaxID=167645 RepID=UPI001291BDFE|nr:efflux RND transporter periplasmic adaptor subunit [Propionivibrio limicola]